MDKIKMIKKDAAIQIKIGSGFLQKIQKILFFIASNLTAEDLEQFKKEAEAFKEGSEFSEDWMEHLTTLSVLLKEIETKAEEQGFTYDQSFNDIIPTES
jgi:hypothetical protein